MISFSYLHEIDGRKNKSALSASAPDNRKIIGNLFIDIDGVEYFEKESVPAYAMVSDFFNWVEVQSKEHKNVEDYGSWHYNEKSDDKMPMIEFIKTKGGWKIKSRYEKFKCYKIFSYEKITDAMHELYDQTLSQIDAVISHTLADNSWANSIFCFAHTGTTR